MITRIMREVRNTFWDGYFLNGKIRMGGGIIELDEHFKLGNAVFLTGSDGSSVLLIHRRNSKNTDKFRVDDKARRMFNSAYRLRVPADFLELVNEIEEYEKSKPGGSIVSEQFGEYRYSIQNKGSFEDVFRTALNKYRKMRDSLLDIVSHEFM